MALAYKKVTPVHSCDLLLALNDFRLQFRLSLTSDKLSYNNDIFSLAFLLIANDWTWGSAAAILVCDAVIEVVNES